MEFYGGAEGTRLGTQGIAFAPRPGSPFDDHGETKREEFLCQFPLERFDLLASVRVVQAQGESLKPVIGTKANRANPALKHTGEHCLSRTGQSADED